jgi:hypothetical protein
MQQGGGFSAAEKSSDEVYARHKGAPKERE